MGFQCIPQSYSSVIKRSLSRLGLKKRYVKLRRRSGLPTTDVASGDKIIRCVPSGFCLRSMVDTNFRDSFLSGTKTSF